MLQRQVELQLSDGQVVSGSLIAQDAATVSIIEEAGQVVVHPKESIAQARIIEAPAPVPAPAPTPTPAPAAAPAPAPVPEPIPECVADDACKNPETCQEGSCQLDPDKLEGFGVSARKLHRAGIGILISSGAVAIAGVALWASGAAVGNKADEIYFGPDGSCGTFDPNNLCGDESDYERNSQLGESLTIAGVSLTSIGSIGIVTGTVIALVGRSRLKRYARYGSLSVLGSRRAFGLRWTGRF
jgi:hypothetical protein